jgi:hypothetical protein
VKIRLIYPKSENLALKGDGRLVNIRVKGESVAILDVNESVNSLPPQNPSRFPIDLAQWRKNPDGWSGSFALPGMREKLEEHAVNCISIPNRLLSQDELQDSNPSLLDMVKPSPDSNPMSQLHNVGSATGTGCWISECRFVLLVITASRYPWRHPSAV